MPFRTQPIKLRNLRWKEKNDDLTKSNLVLTLQKCSQHQHNICYAINSKHGSQQLNITLSTIRNTRLTVYFALPNNIDKNYKQIQGAFLFMNILNMNEQY